MHAYGPPLQLDLWRNTTVAIAGRASAPAPFVRDPAGAGAVCVRDYACPRFTAVMRERLGRAPDFPHCPIAGDELQSVQIEREAYVENPLTRLRAVWQYRILDPAFHASQPHRLVGLPFLPFGDFCRWVMAQDPLATDELVRPQWAMLPDGVLLQRLSYDEVSEPSALARDLARVLYADDFALWDAAQA